MQRISWLVIGLALGGCAANGRDADDSGVRDAGGARDGGSTPDAGSRDGGRADASSDAHAGGDGGTSGIVIDGVIGATEWSTALAARNTVASAWGEANVLSRVLAIVADGSLYVAVEGSLESGAENAILVYVDAERGSGAGVEDPITLSDGEGALDNALSAGLTTPSDFEADYAWGTRDMDCASTGFDDRMGWRDIATDPGDFAWVDSAEAPTSCGATACETRIALATLGGSATGTIALFARLGNTDGTALSNQTVPEDDPDAPGTVSVVLDVPR